MDKTVGSCRVCMNATLVNDKLWCGSTNEEDEKRFKVNGEDAARKCPNYKKVAVVASYNMTLDLALKYMIAGKAHFKITSGKTDRSLYYKLYRTSSKDDVYWLYYGDSTETLDYIGTIYFYKAKGMYAFSKGSNGTANPDDIEVQAILYVMNGLLHNNYNMNVTIAHDCLCGKCRRLLKSNTEGLTGLCHRCINEVYLPKVNVDLNF